VRQKKWHKRRSNLWPARKAEKKLKKMLMMVAATEKW